MFTTFRKSSQRYLIAFFIATACVMHAEIDLVDTPTYASATTQIRTEGTLVYAYTANNVTRTVNGVTFTQVNANTTNWGSGNVTLSGASGSNAARGAPPAAKVPDADYRGLLSGLVWDVDTPYLLLVTLNNLVSGQAYLVQVWTSDTLSNASTRETKYTIANGTETVVFNLDHSDINAANGVGQLATFWLRAQGTSVTMSLTASGTAANMAAISALQVRSTIPANQTWVGANGEEWSTTGARWSDATESDTLWAPGSPFKFRALFTNEALVSLSGTLEAARISGTTNLSLSGSGASLQVGSFSITGTLALAQATLSVKQGLVYRLDASDASKITTLSGTNRVQSWRSSYGSMVFNVSAVPGYSDSPTYDDTAFGGRGGVVFGNGESSQLPSTRLEANQKTNCQTVIFVAKPSATQNDLAGIWGQSGSDSGIRSSGSANWQGALSTAIFHGAAGGSHYLNGVAYAYDANAPFTVGQAHVYSSISASLRSWTNALGNYHNTGVGTNRFYRGEIAEILVYDRKLTDEERNTAEAFLAQKWGVTGYTGIPLPTINKLILTNNATLNLDGSVLTAAAAELGSATLKQGLLSVTNGARITGAFVLDGTHALVNGALIFEAETSITITNQSGGTVFYQPLIIEETASIHTPVGLGVQLKADMGMPFDGTTVPLTVTGGALSMGATSVLTLGLGSTVLSVGTNTVIDGYTGAAPVLYPVSTNNIPANGMASLVVLDGALKLVVELATVETTLTVSPPSTLEYGQTIPVTATVRGPDDAIPGGGTISFYKPDNLIVPIATLDIDGNGQAVYQSAERLLVGSGYTYLAKFNGYGQYLYSVQESSAGLAITPRLFTIESVVPANRLYDATTDAYALGIVQAGDILSGDDLIVWAVGDFADAEPGTEKPFTVNRSALMGAASSNYTANSFSFEGLVASVMTNAVWNGTAGDYAWTQTHQNWVPGGGLPSQSKPFGPAAGWRNHVVWTNSGQNMITLKDTVYVGSFSATGRRIATIYNPDTKAVVFPPEGGRVTVEAGNNLQTYSWNWGGASVSFSGVTAAPTANEYKNDNRGVTNLQVRFTGANGTYVMFSAPHVFGGEQTTVTLHGNSDASVSLNLGVVNPLTGTGFVYSVSSTILSGGFFRSRVGTNTWTSPINVVSNSWIGSRDGTAILNLEGSITVSEGVTNFFNHGTCLGVVNLNNTLVGQAEQSYGTLNLNRSNALAQARFAYNGGTVGWTTPGATLYQMGALNGTASINLSLPEGLTLELGGNDFSGSHAGGLSATGTVRKVGNGLARIRRNSTYANLELAGGTFGTGLGVHTIANLSVQAPMVVSVDVGPEQTSGRLVLSQNTDLSAITLDVWNPGELSKAADYPVMEFTAGTPTALPLVATAIKNKGWKIVPDESNPNVLELRFLPGTLLLLR